MKKEMKAGSIIQQWTKVYSYNIKDPNKLDQVGTKREKKETSQIPNWLGKEQSTTVKSNWLPSLWSFEAHWMGHSLVICS